VRIFTIVPQDNPDELEGYGGLYCEQCADETSAQDMVSSLVPVIYREMSVTYHGWAEETCDSCGVELSTSIDVPPSRDHKGARFDFID
jgi:hypothetical protein